jgi:hypothetical protein
VCEVELGAGYCVVECCCSLTPSGKEDDTNLGTETAACCGF